MSDNDHSAPSFIIYINQTRIPAERAAEIKEILIIDRLNALSTFLIKVADMENEWSENDEYFIGAQVEILLGYKDDITSIITGEVTGLTSHRKKNQEHQVILKGNNHMHKLNRCRTNKAFYDMTIKDIIAEIADEAGMKSEIDELNYKHSFTLQQRETNYEYLMQLADYFDCHFWVDNNTLYFKRLQKNMSEDVVLEYGKTLLEFCPETDTSHIISEVEIKSWNPAKHEVITGNATFNDIDSKGGAVVDDVFSGAGEFSPDSHVLEQKAADQRAIDILESNNRQYVSGNGITNGNTEIRAGKIIKAEGLGEKFSGKYFVIMANHVLVPLKGYTTSFSFISSLGSPVQAGAGAETGPGTGAAAGTKAGEEEQEEQEKNPKITNLVWIKDGEEVTKAQVDDYVVITADAENIPEGERINITIWEKDDIGTDDFIKNFSAYVKNGKIEKEWKVEYHEDTDDIESEEEQEDKGYTLPEYIFKMTRTGSPELESEESPVLEVVDWIELTLIDSETEKPMANEKIKVIQNGEVVQEGTLDENGYIKIEDIYIGKCEIELSEDDE